MKFFPVTNPAAFFILIHLSFCLGCGSPIEKYEPKSPDEKEILSVLVQYQDAKNRFDLNHLLSLLHENGQFSYQCGVMVSKAKLEEKLPDYWNEIKSGNPAAISMVHECINGDSHKSGKLVNPRMVIDHDTAEASVWFINGFTRLPQYFSLTRETDGWSITRTEWGQN